MNIIPAATGPSPTTLGAAIITIWLIKHRSHWTLQQIFTHIAHKMPSCWSKHRYLSPVYVSMTLSCSSSAVMSPSTWETASDEHLGTPIVGYSQLWIVHEKPIGQTRPIRQAESVLTGAIWAYLDSCVFKSVSKGNGINGVSHDMSYQELFFTCTLLWIQVY